jgi:hypothetical protein
MKKKLLFLTISLMMGLIVASFLGCSTIQPQIAKFDDQNAANTMAWGKQIMKHWSMNSQAIHIGVGDEIINTKLPAEFERSLKALDGMCEKFCVNQDAMTEADATSAIMHLGKLIAPAVQAIIQQYAPNVWSQVLKYIPSFITL